MQITVTTYHPLETVKRRAKEGKKRARFTQQKCRHIQEDYSCTCRHFLLSAHRIDASQVSTLAINFYVLIRRLKMRKTWNLSTRFSVFIITYGDL